MIVLIPRRALAAGAVALCCLLALAAAAGGLAGEKTPAAVSTAERLSIPMVLIDPGHGGEDGGAVAGDGTAESHLNLAVALDLEQVLALVGVPARMTRREDVMVCDGGLSSLRQRKASDLHNRVKMAQALPGAALISIHQNALPSSPQTHGAQAFYSPHPLSRTLAEGMQRRLNAAVNTHRAKQARQIPGSIYLMNRVAAPAVLVECGFLSNAEETALLKTSGHQMTLAVSIAAGYLGWLAGEEGA